MNQEVLSKVKNLPKLPGIYKFKNSMGKIIYVGKAKSLRNRVGSYFKLNLDPNSKTYSLVQRIADLEFIEAKSEFDALMLEAELIKKYKPKYNISLKDDKSYLYIVLRKDEFEFDSKKEKITKVLTARKTDLQKTDIIFGPYVDSTTAKHVLKTVRKIIMFRDCSSSKFSKYRKLGNPCLYGHIGLCTAPCVNNDAKSLSAYKDNINTLKRILSGDSSAIVKDLNSKMNAASEALEFEQAASYRNLLNKFIYITSGYSDPKEYILNPYLVEDTRTKAIIEIKNLLPFLLVLPRRIECYDISNISGKDSVGSMVVAIDGKITNSEYKKFKIRLKDTPDDFEMMREVLRRRLKRTEWGMPDLIVVDGGKGQVGAVDGVLKELNINVPLIGLAKRFETIVIKNENNFTEIRIAKDNPGMALLIALRDESHRFAQKYHHQLRLRKIQNV